VDRKTFARMSCCGKAAHTHCEDRFFGSSLSREQKGKCPHCQVKLKSSDEERFELVRGWADKGKAWAQAYLGDHYCFGKGVEQSYEKAIEYLTLAIHQDDPNAMFQLAFMYERGEGVTKSFEKAIELYTQAANQGHASAQFNLGVMCYNGDGIDQSNELAREWWIKAAVQDQENALKSLQALDGEEGRTTPTLLCCSTCGKPKTPLRPLHPCKLCRTVQYCGRECQVQHWKKGGHRRECKKFREAAAEDEGRTTPTVLCCSSCGKPKTLLRPLKPCKLCGTVQFCDRNCSIVFEENVGHRRKCKKIREAAAAKTVPKEVE
jgi:hypothetical protein